MWLKLLYFVAGAYACLIPLSLITDAPIGVIIFNCVYTAYLLVLILAKEGVRITRKS
jgi:hypothetical protein